MKSDIDELKVLAEVKHFATLGAQRGQNPTPAGVFDKRSASIGNNWPRV